MANEITISARLSFSKGGAKVSRSEVVQVTVTGDAFTHEVQSVAITNTEIEQGALLGSPGYVFMKNLDATNYVEVGYADTHYTIKLKAGEVTLFRSSGENLYAKANTLACKVEYLIIED